MSLKLCVATFVPKYGLSEIIISTLELTSSNLPPSPKAPVPARQLPPDAGATAYQTRWHGEFWGALGGLSVHYWLTKW